MKLKTRIAALAALSLITTASLVPVAKAQDNQAKKNTARNLGIGAAAIAGNGLLHHNSTATVLGLAGAGIAAKNYEDTRKAENRAKRERELQRQRYRRYHHRYYAH